LILEIHLYSKSDENGKGRQNNLICLTSNMHKTN
jgi:hypothetical protein